ncbi:MAG: VOC family protein [Pricia sp.]|nr:VOC family protein [Pricia sp.]
MQKVINGIQQIGIGVADAKAVFNWYRRHLGFDILVFQDVATASLMTRYTGDIAYERCALLALNMVGGGGLEIWQFKNRTPIPPTQTVQIGDLGINLMKIRARDLYKIHARLKNISLEQLTELGNEPHFFFVDPWNNLVQVVEEDYVFSDGKCSSGGVLGVMVGVSDMEISLKFYQELLGYDIVLSDRIGTFADLDNLKGGKGVFRRVILRHGDRATGGFSELYGPSQIELVQTLDRMPNKIYKNRFWGDLGYIHLCYDIQGMDRLSYESKKMNYPFTVDSADSFDMGEAAGRFGYLEDPDGTLIELVETHKVPILKRLGIYINLKKRNPIRPLPKWLVKAMKIHRVAFDL